MINRRENACICSKNMKSFKKVLVVDDNPDILSLFVELLKLKDFQVVGTGSDGKEAVDLFQTLQPDITFLDVVMPIADGIYALEKIREISPESIVIMITADLSSGVTKMLEDLKATAVIHKPFDINDLMKIVNDLESDKNFSKIKFFN